jgi:hypothetical protein
MKNLILAFGFALVANITFAQVTLVSPFIQKSDTITLVGISPNEVKIELAEYACNVRVETTMQILNENELSENAVSEIYGLAIAEAIEAENKIATKIDRFRNVEAKNNGNTAKIDRTVTVFVKQGTVIQYN